MPRTLFEKVWDAHVVRAAPGEPSLLYIDLHLIHEVTSPQAFDGLRAAGRAVRRPDLTIATVDHNVPTTDRKLPIADPIAAKQIEALQRTTRFNRAEDFLRVGEKSQALSLMMNNLSGVNSIRTITRMFLRLLVPTSIMKRRARKRQRKAFERYGTL